MTDQDNVFGRGLCEDHYATMATDSTSLTICRCHKTEHLDSGVQWNDNPYATTMSVPDIVCSGRFVSDVRQSDDFLKALCQNAQVIVLVPSMVITTVIVMGINNYESNHGYNLG